MIALGVGGFILMDMMSGNTSIFGSSQFIIGDIEGEKIDYNEFARTEDILYRGQSGEVYTRRNVLWNYFVEKVLVEQEAEALGLTVSKPELLELEFGTYLSPIITQRFSDPNTFQVDRAQLNNIKSMIESNQFTDPDARNFWSVQEKEIMKDRLQTKMGNMVGKAMYTPNWVAELAYREQNERTDFRYVQVPFDAVDNNDVALADSDYANYLKAHGDEYKQDEETRRVSLVILTAKPTAADSVALRDKLTAIANEWQTGTTSDSIFVLTKGGQLDEAYLNRDQINPDIVDSLFRMSTGGIYGPYVEGTDYVLARLVAKKVIPDSVRARHILIPAGTTQQEFLAAAGRVDSLKQLLDSGAARFDSLAFKFGTDATQSKGGDLGFAGPGMMVQPFNDLIFYRAEPGKVYTVTTQFGIHLVEVTDRKFINNKEGVRVAYIREPIVPSDATQTAVQDRANVLMQTKRSLDELIAAASEEQDIEVETSDALKANDFFITALGPGQTSRDIVKWAYSPGTRVNNVASEVFIYRNEALFYNERFVLAGLKSIIPAGLPPVADIKDQIEPLVINEKKAEIIMSKISGQSSLEGIAGSYGSKVDTARSASLSTGFITGVGAEPVVVAKALGLDANQVSAPIKGNSGVFVVQVMSKEEAGAAQNLESVRQQNTQMVSAQLRSRLITALRKNADIEDNRSKFF